MPHEYLQRPELTRLWQACKDKYLSIGRIGGTVTLKHLSPDEQEALSGLLGVPKHKTSSVNLKDVDSILRASSFSLGLEELLSHFFGSLASNTERRNSEEQEWINFCQELEQQAKGQHTKKWLSEQAPALHALKEQRGNLSAVHKVIHALDQLPLSQPTQLPIFAAEVSGDPHFLDNDSFPGKLFYHGLAASFQIGELIQDPDSLADRQVYRLAGLVLDELSSQVWVAGLAYNGIITPAVLSLPLSTVSTLSLPGSSQVYVCENPSIMATIINHPIYLAHYLSLPPLVCTSGQPSAAAITLLDRLTSQGTHIHYSGDLDAGGIQIAASLYKRYSPHFSPWGMSSSLVSLEKGVTLSSDEVGRLSKLHAPWDKGLVPALLDHGVKVYQESLVDHLWTEYSHMKGPATQDDAGISHVLEEE